jgi:hypothetical protein
MVTVSQKTAFSFFISMLLVAGAAAVAYTGLFDLLETRFYNPAIARSLDRETGKDARVIQQLVSELQNRFSRSLGEAAVRSSFLPSQSVADVFERARIYNIIMESVTGMYSVRFIDDEGRRILFSTYPADSILADEHSILYCGYGEAAASLPFEAVQVSAHEKPRLVMDNTRERIIFAFPFFDSMDVYRGVALFTVSARAAVERLIGEGRIKAGDDISLTASPPGIVSGIPGVSKTEMLARVSALWNEGTPGPSPLVSAESRTALVLVSAQTSQGVYYGRLVNEEVFTFPPSMKMIILAAIFCTIYLIVFFLLNIRQDPLTVIQNRLKILQISLIEQFYDIKGDIDWDYWIMELEQRREGIRDEVKQGVQMGKHGYIESDVDSLIDKSWDELVSLVGGRRMTGGIDEQQLRRMVQRILCSYETPAAEGRPRLHRTALSRNGRSVPPSGGMEDIGELEPLDGSEAAAEGPAPAAVEKPAEKNAPSVSAAPGGGLLAAAMRKQAKKKLRKKSNVRLAFGDDDIPYIVESSGLEIVEETESLAADGLSAGSPQAAGEALAELTREIEFSPVMENGTEESGGELDEAVEVVSPFASILSSLDTGGGKGRQAAAGDSGTDVIFEQNGVHYIHVSAFTPDKNTEEKLDNTFRTLIESVVSR